MMKGEILTIFLECDIMRGYLFPACSFQDKSQGLSYSCPSWSEIVFLAKHGKKTCAKMPSVGLLEPTSFPS